MSYATKAAATRAGQLALQAVRKRGKLRLNGVELEVWENLGWHWRLGHQHFGLYLTGTGTPGKPNDLHCLMSPNGRGCGRPAWTGNETSPYADQLLRACLKRAKAELVELQSCVDEVEALLR